MTEAFSTIGSRAAIRGRKARDVVRVAFYGCIAVGCVAFAHAMGIVLCPLKRFFGIPCPTCGLTRAVAHLLRFELRDAFEVQPLATSIICLLPLLTSVSCVLWGWRRTITLGETVLRSWTFWSFFAIAMILNWVYVFHRGN